MRAVARPAAACALVLALGSTACKARWDTAPNPLRDEELEQAFFSGLNSIDVPDLPEPSRLRPCCVFGDEIGVGRRVPIPGYEVSNVLEVGDLGTHVYNHGALTLQRLRDEGGLVSDEASGILYTCRGGFIDIAHVRDNADRTLYLAAQIGRLPATGGTIPLVDEGAVRRIVVYPLDAELVRTYGIREVVIQLAEWLDFQASIWHEIATWYRWSTTAFSEQPSAFSPEDLYSNLLGLKIAGEIIRRHAAGSEEEYDRNVTALLADALTKLGPLPREASRFAFEYVDGIWWDSSRRVPDNQLVRHRYLDIGPKLYPWKLMDAEVSDTLLERKTEYTQVCGGDWTPLGLNVPEHLGGVPFRQMATLEIRPGPKLLENGFRLPESRREFVTQDDFPALIEAIRESAEQELGAGASSPAARPDETSRYRE
jgi:hypothetical protein